MMRCSQLGAVALGIAWLLLVVAATDPKIYSHDQSNDDEGAYDDEPNNRTTGALPAPRYIEIPRKVAYQERYGSISVATDEPMWHSVFTNVIRPPADQGGVSVG